MCRSQKQPANHSYGTVYSCSIAVKNPYRRPYNIIIWLIVSDFGSYLEPFLEQAYRAKWPHATISQSWIYRFIALFRSLTVHVCLAGSHEFLSAFRTAHMTFPQVWDASGPVQLDCIGLFCSSFVTSDLSSAPSKPQVPFFWTSILFFVPQTIKPCCTLSLVSL